MSETVSPTSRATTRPGPSAGLFATAAQNGDKLLQCWSRGPATALQTGLDLYRDGLDLAQADLNDGLEAWRTLLGCRSAEELVNAQTRLAGQARARLTGRMERVARRWLDAVDGAVARPASPRAGRG